MASADTAHKVVDFITAQGLIREHDRVLVAVSAGKDSMALLHLLLSFREELGFTMGLFHLNHLVRGDEALRDEEFLKVTAGTLSLPLFCERYDFAAHRVSGLSFEEHAREVRYRLAQETASREGYCAIATAHTGSDNAETILMRLFTGTGLQGLRGIPSRRGNIIRPLLPLTAEEVYDFLVKKGIPWREDSSNSDAIHDRNFVRHRLAPLIRERYPHFERAVTGTALIADEAIECIDGMTRALFGTIHWREGNETLLDAGDALSHHPVFPHLLADFIRKHGGIHPTRGMIEEITRRLKSNRSHLTLYENRDIRLARTIRRGKRVITLSPASALVPAPFTPWEYAVSITENETATIVLHEIGLFLEITVVDAGINTKGGDTLCIAIDDSVPTIAIRNRRVGDRMKTDGGTKKIKELFIEKKLDTKQKDAVPLLLVNNAIAAIMMGLLYDAPSRVAEPFLVTNHTKKVLAIARKNR